MQPLPTEAVQTAWARLLRAHAAALGHVEAALKRAGLPPLAWYDVLLELERAAGGGLRPVELEARTLLPQYGLSRLIDRMAASGLVERRPCPEDGRGQLVGASDAGLRLRQRMWPVYAAAMQEAVGDRLSDPEAAELGKLLGRLVGPAAPAVRTLP